MNILSIPYFVSYYTITNYAKAVEASTSSKLSWQSVKSCGISHSVHG